MFTRRQTKPIISSFIVLIVLTSFFMHLPVLSQPDNRHWITSVDWNHDINRIAIGYYDGTIEIVDPINNQIIQQTQLAVSLVRFEWNIDGSKLIINSNYSSVISLMGKRYKC